MSDTKKKLNLSTITEQAAAIAADKDAQNFVKQAQKSTKNVTNAAKKDEKASKTKSSYPKKQTSRINNKKTNIKRMIVVEGHLRNRDVTCRKAIQLYVLNEIADWIETNAVGTQQVILNHLLKRGILSVEEEYDKIGTLFVEEGIK